jgi:hypothetical protein
MLKTYIIFLLITAFPVFALDPMTAQEAVPLAKAKAEARCACSDLTLMDVNGQVDVSGKVSHSGSDGWSIQFFSESLQRVYPVEYIGGEYKSMFDIEFTSGKTIPDGWIDSSIPVQIFLDANNGMLREYINQNPSTKITANLYYQDQEEAFIWGIALMGTENFAWIDAFTQEIHFLYIDPTEAKPISWKDIKSGY